MGALSQRLFAPACGRGFLLGQGQLRKKTCHRFLDGCQTRGAGWFLVDKDGQMEVPDIQIASKPNSLTDEPFDAVSEGGISHPLGNGDDQAKAGLHPFNIFEFVWPAMPKGSFGKDAGNLFFTTQAIVLFKEEPTHSGVFSPCGGEQIKPCARWRWTCACESRAPFCAWQRWVERSVS